MCFFFSGKIVDRKYFGFKGHIPGCTQNIPADEWSDIPIELNTKNLIWYYFPYCNNPSFYDFFSLDIKKTAEASSLPGVPMKTSGKLDLAHRFRWSGPNNKHRKAEAVDLISFSIRIFMYRIFLGMTI